MKKEAASKETKAKSRKEKRPKVTIKDVHSLKNRRLLGEYNYRDMIVFILTIVLAPLGILSFLKNLRLTIFDPDFSCIFNMISSFLVLFSFTSYYVLLGLKRKYKLIPAISFVFYSISFFIGADKGYFINYILIFFSSLFIIFSVKKYRNAIGFEILYIWINAVIFIIKATFNLPQWVIFNGSLSFSIRIAFVLFLTVAGVLAVCYVLCNEIYEHFHIKKELEKNTLTEKEIMLVFMILLQYGKTEICKVLRITSSTFDNHSSNIKKKLGLYCTLSREKIRNKLNDPKSEKSSQ